MLPRASGGCDDTNARGLCQHGGPARASCTSTAWPRERHVHVPRGSAGCMYVRPSCGGAAGATHGRLRPCVASSGAGVGRRGAAEGQPECACVARLRAAGVGLRGAAEGQPGCACVARLRAAGVRLRGAAVSSRSGQRGRAPRAPARARTSAGCELGWWKRVGLGVSWGLSPEVCPPQVWRCVLHRRGSGGESPDPLAAGVWPWQLIPLPLSQLSNN